MKRYFVLYDDDVRKNQLWASASSIKTAKSYVRKVRNYHPELNPRNIRIFDGDADVDSASSFVPCIYHCD